MGKILGLDIGIASIGHCLINEETRLIENIGVRIFDKAEHPKDGSSLAAPRREARLTRRRINRRRRRLNGILQIFSDNKLPIEYLQNNLPKGKHLTPWELRKEALERELSPEEWARILYHIAGHRGYQSIKRNEEAIAAEEKGGEDKKMLAGIKHLQEQAEKYETIAAYLSDQKKQRNHHGSYSHTINRGNLRKEVEILFQKQKDFGNEATSTDFMEKFSALAFEQRPLKASEELVGYCSIFPEEKRAPKYSLIAEQFIAWQRLNNLKIIQNAENISLSFETKQAIFKEALTKRRLSFKRLHKILSDYVEGYEASQIKFNLCNYNIPKKDGETSEKIKEAVEKRVFIELKAYHQLKKNLLESKICDEQEFNMLIEDVDICDNIAKIISFYPDHKIAKEKLEELDLPTHIIDGLLSLSSWSGTIGLSHKALREIVPQLAEGRGYSSILKELGWLSTLKGHNKGKLLPFPKIANPVVTRAAAQTRKVINAYIAQFGKPDFIHIEVANDFGKSIKKRKDENREQNKYVAYLEKMKETARQQLGLDRELSKIEFIKYRLWKEQDGFCLYSAKPIHILDILDETKLEIDHAIPRSRSFDDSWRNKVLCFTDENRNKGDKTPCEYMLSSPQKWNQFKALCKNLDNAKKAAYISMENFDDKKSENFKSRALNDTRYMARFIAEHIQKELAGEQEIFASDKRAYVKVRPGRLTSFLRHHWGLGDKDRNSHYHHAIDAAIIAASNQSLVQQVSETLKGYDRGDKKEKPMPWPRFREDVLEQTQDIFVSHMPRRKHSGALHDATIKGIKYEDNYPQYETKRVKIKGFKTDAEVRTNLKKMVGIEFNAQGEAMGRSLAVYEAINEWLDTPKDVRSDYPQMPLSSEKIAQGMEPTPITSFKTQSKNMGGVYVRGGIADRANMVYVDIYQHKKSKKFFIVPVYSHQLAKGEKPCHAIIENEPEEKWPLMDEDYQFLFNLYPKDYVELVNKKGEVIEGYYIATDRARGSIELRPHEKAVYEKGEKKCRPRVKAMLEINKYDVDILGNKHLVKKGRGK